MAKGAVSVTPKHGVKCSLQQISSVFYNIQSRYGFFSPVTGWAGGSARASEGEIVQEKSMQTEGNESTVSVLNA